MSDSDRDRRRQVIPDVDEGHEYFGYSASGLIQVYTPAFATWFVGINLMPGGWRWVGIILGALLFIAATIAVLAAPSHLSPGAYAKSVWRHYSQQGVELHE